MLFLSAVVSDGRSRAETCQRTCHTSSRIWNTFLKNNSLQSLQWHSLSLEGTGNNDSEYFIGCWKKKESSWCSCIISSFLKVRKLRPRAVKEVTLDLTVSLHVWVRPKLSFPFWCPIITWEQSQENMFQTLEPKASGLPFPFFARCSPVLCSVMALM